MVDEGCFCAEEAGGGEFDVDDEVKVCFVIVGGDADVRGGAFGAVVREDGDCCGDERGELAESCAGFEAGGAEPAFAGVGTRERRGATSAVPPPIPGRVYSQVARLRLSGPMSRPQ